MPPSTLGHYFLLLWKMSRLRLVRLLENILAWFCFKTLFSLSRHAKSGEGIGRKGRPPLAENNVANTSAGERATALQRKARHQKYERPIFAVVSLSLSTSRSFRACQVCISQEADRVIFLAFFSLKSPGSRGKAKERKRERERGGHFFPRLIDRAEIGKTPSAASSSSHRTARRRREKRPRSSQPKERSSLRRQCCHAII